MFFDSPQSQYIMVPKAVLEKKIVIFTNFEGRQNLLILRGSARQKKGVKIFEKISRFSGLFFQHLSCGAKTLAETGSFYYFGRARKISLAGKKVNKIFIFFEKPPHPPRENPRSAPATYEEFKDEVLFLG